VSKTATFKAPARLALEGTSSFAAAQGKSSLAVSIVKKRCEDAMSGKPYAYAVTMTLDGKRYEGCGETL